MPGTVPMVETVQKLAGAERLLVGSGVGGNGRVANKSLKPCWANRRTALDVKTTVCTIWLSIVGMRHAPSDYEAASVRADQSWEGDALRDRSWPSP